MTFSSGRDSSLLLAVAAEVAACEGLEPPIALTFWYPGDPVADESSWQELVLAHPRQAGLRLERFRHAITTELDNTGPLIAPVLRAHGAPTFPAGLGNTILLAQHARGGSLVTGNAATRYPVAWLADVPPASTAMVLQQSRLASRTEAP